MSLTFTKSSSVAQKVSGSLALIFSIISLGVIATWFQLHDVGALTDDPALHQGGLNWRNNIFNWHPILMTAGFILSFVWALLSFRLFPFDQKVNKFIHSFFHCASVVCWSLGLFAVVQRDNHNEYQYYGFYLIDLWSPHSWIGVTTMAWYGGVFLFGLLGFGFGLIPLELRPKYIGLHVSFGIITLVLVVASMESGIAELMGLDSICWPDYTVTSADTNPAANYSKHSFGCRLGNGAAILVLLTVMFTMHALIDVPTLQTTPLIAVKLPTKEAVEEEKKDKLTKEDSLMVVM